MHVDARLTFLEAVLAQKDKPDLECDGFSRLAHTMLTLMEVPHSCHLGALAGPDQVVRPHFWLSLLGHVVDFKARMWLGPEAPHGIFVPSAPYEYRDDMEMEMGGLSPVVFGFLSGEELHEVLPKTREVPASINEGVREESFAINNLVYIKVSRESESGLVHMGQGLGQNHNDARAAAMTDLHKKALAHAETNLMNGLPE